MVGGVKMFCNFEGRKNENRVYTLYIEKNSVNTNIK